MTTGVPSSDLKSHHNVCTVIVACIAYSRRDDEYAAVHERICADKEREDEVGCIGLSTILECYHSTIDKVTTQLTS